MSKLLRTSLVLGTVMAALIGVVHIQPSWAATISRDWLNLGDLEETMQSHLRQEMKLDEQLESAHQRFASRRRIVADVIAKRASLVQAAGEMRRLNQALPAFSRSYFDTFGGKSEGERLCRYVIHVVQVDLSERTLTQDATTVEQLEGDLKALLQQDGTVHLPAE
jgi:hypothetical protein